MSTAELVADELQAKVKRLAFPAQPGEPVKGCLNRVARRAGVTHTEAKRIWYREWRVIPAHIADKIRDAWERHERQIDKELATEKTRYWALNHCSTDPEFYSERTREGDPPPDQLG